MKKEFKNFIRGAKKDKLSNTERSLLRSKILEFISYNPIRGKMPVIRERNYISMFEVRYFAKAASLVLIIAVVAGGSGVSLAASSALPGDKLYGIKVNVNESIEDSFARTTEARVIVQSKKVERRLVEAQTLDKENKLSPEIQDIVDKKLEEHIDKLTEDIEDLRAEGNLELALETTSNLTPVLEAHKEILKEKEEENLINHENTDVLIARVEDSIREVEDSENAIIATVSDGTEDTEGATMMMSMKATDPVEDEFVKQAQDEIDEISEDIEKIVKSRIKTAKEKISLIKSSRELELSILKPTVETKTEEVTPVPVAEETVIDPLIKKQANEKVSDVETVVNTPVVEAPTIKTPEVSIEEDLGFDIDGKIKEAESLIREAEDKLDRNKFKEALSLAQEVNRIASEIETYKKLKALDLAQKAIELQKALKAEVTTSINN